MFKSVFIVLYLFLSFNLFSQNCFEFYKGHCTPPKSRFHYTLNNNSVSYKFSSGELRQIPITLYAGKDYRITICADSIFDNIISFRIVKTDGKVLYDNSECDYSLNTEFSNLKTKDVLFEITAPPPLTGDGKAIYLEGCIGVYIEEMISLKTGF